MEDQKKKKHQKHPNQTPSTEGVEERALTEEKKVESTEEDDLGALKKKLEAKGKEAEENHERMLRVAADLDNYKKRAAREKEELIKYGNEDLIKAILPFIDHLEKAVGHSETTQGVQGLVEGVKLTIQQLLQALNKFGLSPVESLGKPFDPAFHEAMMVVQTDQHEPNQVVEEFRRGYLLNDRLIRPATVSVSKPLDKEAQTTR